ncbi:MAG TPA: ABC transporter permease [Bryobacteraceae bacterium]|nr:ABC transporter permease [Bryobacteraceae bacterium]
MTTLWQDIVHGSRMLLHKPGFTTVAALSLALGIAANTIVFTLIDTTLLRPLDYPDANRLVLVWTVPLARRNQNEGMLAPNFFALRDHNRSFASVSALWTDRPANIGAAENGAPAEKINGQTFAAGMFETLGVQPILGRTFTAKEDQVGDQAPVVVISDRFWRSQFQGDRNIIGKTIRMDGVPTSVIGVMPPGFNLFDPEADYWAPIPFSPTVVQSTQFTLGVVARLKPGVSIRQAQAEMDTFAAQRAAADPERNKDRGARVQPLQEAAYGNLRQPLLILQVAVAFVLLIGCANVAGLMLARAASRRTEIAIRTAIGAVRGRIVRQLITESVPLSLLGGLLGLFLAWAGLRLFVSLAPPQFPRLGELSLDAVVLAFTALVALATALVFGIAPAIQASRPNLVHCLKESGRSGTDSVARQHLRGALVAVQIALAVVLLIGAGLMINSFVRVQNNHLGADPKGLLSFEFRFSQDETIKPYGRYRNAGLWDVNPMTTLTFQRVFERIQSLPAVQSAAGSSTPPMAGALQVGFLIEGRPAPPSGNGQPGQNAAYIAITPNYFATLKTPILQGRGFTDRDTSSAPPVIIINQALARRYWPNENPLGRHIAVDYVPNEPLREIVGVVGDVRLSRQQREPQPILYVPYLQQTPRWMGAGYAVRSGMFFVLRTAGDPLSLVPAVRRAVSEVDRDRPAANFRTVEQYLDQQVQYVRIYVVLLAVFGGIAALLAAIGIYGIMAYSVAERTREIGIRMALGAGTRDVLGLMLRQALLLVLIGVILGLASSFALTRVIRSALFGVTATDPPTYAAVALLLLAVAIAACVIPTRRAVQVDPTEALRYE